MPRPPMISGYQGSFVLREIGVKLTARSDACPRSGSQPAGDGCLAGLSYPRPWSVVRCSGAGRRLCAEAGTSNAANPSRIVRPEGRFCPSGDSGWKKHPAVLIEKNCAPFAASLPSGRQGKVPCAMRQDQADAQNSHKNALLVIDGRGKRRP